MTKTCFVIHAYIEKIHVGTTSSDEMEYTGVKCSPERHCALRFASSQTYLNREPNED
jgi:hypothetical protein